MHPANVVRHDDDDPYLVVAADKGTASFSDIANAIADEHGFWLSDAFASGGSAGYDHKKMGITARGAWESVKRHFREIDVDIGRTPFTVAGVGDMSGDVFGNGMLQERTIRLVAAFDASHLHRPCTRPGAQLYRAAAPVRSAALELAGLRSRADLRRRRGVRARAEGDRAGSAGARSPRAGGGQGDPVEVMSAILQAPVDLLYFGGIGTFVRASSETDDAVGDRANDALRVPAPPCAAR